MYDALSRNHLVGGEKARSEKESSHIIDTIINRSTAG